MSQARQTNSPLIAKLIDDAIFWCSQGDGDLDDLEKLALNIKTIFDIQDTGLNYKFLLSLPFTTPLTEHNQDNILSLQHRIIEEARIFYRANNKLFLFRAAMILAFAAKWFPVYVEKLKAQDEIMAIINKDEYPLAFETFLLNSCNKSETFTKRLNMLWLEIEKATEKREECIKLLLEEIIDESSLTLKSECFTPNNLLKLKSLLSTDEIELTVIPLMVARQATQFITKHRKLYEFEYREYEWVFDFVTGKDPEKKPEAVKEKPKVAPIRPKPPECKVIYRTPIAPTTNHAYNPLASSYNVRMFVMKNGESKPAQPEFKAKLT